MMQPIFLIGPRGCGKTTVGKALAQAMSVDFTDTDICLRQFTGMTVAEIVDKEGWSGFRTHETNVLRRVIAPSTVIATGGGIVLAEENRLVMRESGVVVYLRAPVHTLVMRLAASPEAGQRPTLTGKPIIDEVSEVLAVREPLYCETAHHILEATRDPDDIVSDLLQHLGIAQAG